MDTFELKKEQFKLAPKVSLRDGFEEVKTIGGVICLPFKNSILAYVVVCEYPSMKLIEKRKYVLHNPLPHKPGYDAYRMMPAMIEAYNMLNKEPEILFVKGDGILHPRKIGLASHLGLVLNKSVIGINDKLKLGKVEQGKIMFANKGVGFEIKTKEHAKPIYITQGHLISLGSMLKIVKKTILFPHKIPEPIHLAQKFAKNKIKRIIEKEKVAECELK